MAIEGENLLRLTALVCACIALTGCNEDDAVAERGVTTDPLLVTNSMDTPGFQFAYSGSKGISPAMAEAERRLSPAFDTCVDEQPLGCLVAELARQDTLLNTAYGAAMERLSTTERNTLRLAERAWIVERDAHCEGESEAMGSGTVAERQVYCTLIETTHRTSWLEAYGR